MRILKKSHSAEKLRRGGHFGRFETSLCCKISKNLKGDPLEAEKSSKKSRTVPKKNRKGDPLVPSGFVAFAGYSFSFL